jgi:four helix bundle protein
VVRVGPGLNVDAGQPPGAKPRDICKRSFAYGLRAIKLYKFLQEKKDGASWILGKQYLRAATSIGANIEEAQSGETKADFIHKYGIAQKEAKVSHYWLRLLGESGLVSVRRLTPLMRETEELYAVITAIIRNAKHKLKEEKQTRPVQS